MKITDTWIVWLLNFSKVVGLLTFVTLLFWGTLMFFAWPFMKDDAQEPDDDCPCGYCESARLEQAGQ